MEEKMKIFLEKNKDRYSQTEKDFIESSLQKLSLLFSVPEEEEMALIERTADKLMERYEKVLKK